jgi:hypothetical protein
VTPDKKSSGLGVCHRTNITVPAGKREVFLAGKDFYECACCIYPNRPLYFLATLQTGRKFFARIEGK